MPSTIRRGLLAAAVTGLVALAGCRTTEPSAGTAYQLNAVVTEDAPSTFTVSAPNVTGLYPGAVKQLQVTVANPYSFDISITNLWGTLDATSTTRCAVSPDNLTVRVHQGAALPLVVGARSGRAAGTIPLYMPNTVVDACQRATFAVSLHGTAMKVKK